MHLSTSLTSLSTLLNVVYQYVTEAFTVSGIVVTTRRLMHKVLA